MSAQSLQSGINDRGSLAAKNVAKLVASRRLKQLWIDKGIYTGINQRSDCLVRPREPADLWVCQRGCGRWCLRSGYADAGGEPEVVAGIPRVFRGL